MSWQRTLPKPGLGMAVVLCLVAVGAQLFAAIPLGVTDIILEQGFHKPALRLASHPVAIGFVNIVAFGLVIWLGLRQNRLRPAQALRFGRVAPAQVSAVLLVVLGLGGVVSEMDNVMRMVFPMPQFLLDLFKEAFFPEGKLFSQIFLLVIVAPITEELFFRGIILRGLLSQYRPGRAVLITALLFGGVHLNPWQFVSATLLGVAFGWFYLRTESIGLCVLAHAMANGLSILITSLPVDIPGLTGMPDPHHVEFQPWWVDVTALILVTAGIWLLRKTPAAVSLEEPREVPPVIVS